MIAVRRRTAFRPAAKHALRWLDWVTQIRSCIRDLCVYFIIFVHISIDVRTNIDIDDRLMAEALKVTGARTKREAVELGLKALIQMKRQESIRGYRGKLQWRDDLARMRLDE